MKRKTTKQRRGELAACEEDGETYWFYGWDLTDDDLQWPEYDQSSDDYEMTKTNGYARWIFQQGETRLWECKGPKQGAMRITRVDVDF